MAPVFFFEILYLLTSVIGVLFLSFIFTLTFSYKSNSLFLFTVVKGLTLDNGHDVPVDAGNPSIISFTYTSTGSNMTTDVTIHADQIIVIPGVLSENDQTGQVVILPEDLSNLAFGQYAITVLLQGEPDILETLDAVMFYEEVISGLQVSYSLSVIIYYFKSMTMFTHQYTILRVKLFIWLK